MPFKHNLKYFWANNFIKVPWKDLDKIGETSKLMFEKSFEVYDFMEVEKNF